MKRHFILIFALSTAFSASTRAQLHPLDKTIDFKIINRGDERLFESTITNNGDKAVTLLRVDAQSIYDVRVDRRRIEPNHTLSYRVKINPLKVEPRTDQLNFLFNSEVISISMKADVRYVDPADSTPCPDFDLATAISQSDWKAYFKVVDKKSGELIPNVDIQLHGKMSMKVAHSTGRKGELLIELPIDFYIIKATKEGYRNYSLESYINRRSHNFLLEMIPEEMGADVPLRTETKEGLNDKVANVKAIAVETNLEPTADSSEFSITEFKANNVVFLIDVSTSMRQENRIDILKANMISLAEMLRPEDVISLVTYASTTKVILSGKRADDIEGLSRVINDLEAEGMSAGEAGLKQAYRVCSNHFIQGGNNHVYLATDGAFNKGSGKLIRLVSKKASRNMNLSILAIRSSEWTYSKMRALSNAGNGQHVSIGDKESERDLRDLIKVQSKR